MARERMCEVEFDRRHQLEVGLRLMAGGWRVCNGTGRYPDINAEWRVVLALRGPAAGNGHASPGEEVGAILRSIDASRWQIRNDGVTESGSHFRWFDLSLDGDTFTLATLGYVHETPDAVLERCADALGVGVARVDVAPGE